MHTFSNHIDTFSNRESWFSSRDRADADSAGTQLPSGSSQLFSSLNCNRIALKCLKIRGNQLCESVMMMAVGALLQWFDRQLVKPIQIDEGNPLRTVTVFDCIQYQRDAQAQAYTSYLYVGKSQTRLLPSRVALNQLLPDQWMEAALTQAIAVEYLNTIKSNREVYRRLQQETLKLIESDPRFQHLLESLLPCALALDENIVAIANHILPHGNASFDDLTLIWRNLRTYQRMMAEENQLLRLFHLTRLQRMKRQGKTDKPSARCVKQTTDLALVAVF